MDSLTNLPFDAVIPYHEKDSEILPYCLEALRKNIQGVRNIYIISKECPDIDESFQWISEDSFPFTMSDVGKYIQSTNGREGWYYQQLVKLYAHKVIPDLLQHHLIVDSDVVFVRPVSFFKEGKVLLDHGGMYVQQYMDHMQRLLPEDFLGVTDDGGTTDCMMFRTDILGDLFQRVESRHTMLMWEALLSHVLAERFNKSGMSEQEIYFQFAILQYPESHQLRLLEKSRGVYLNELQRTDVDFISFHAWFRDWQRGLTKCDS